MLRGAWERVGEGRETGGREEGEGNGRGRRRKGEREGREDRGAMVEL